MSIFNPQVSPTQDPNYLGYAKVIDAPPPNQSTGLAFATAAHGLEGFVKASDTAIKTGIDNEAYKRIDPERDRMTAGLEQAKKDTTPVVPAPVQTAAGTTTGKSLLDANASMDEPDVPDGVSQGLDRITQLSEARKAVKINDTQYSGNVLSIAKQLRAQYPGYREYVDEKVSQVSGLPVANAYYKNLMEDINRQLTAAQGQGNKIEGLYLKNLDVPNITEVWWPKYKTGEITESQFISKISSWQNLQTQYKIDGYKRAEESHGWAGESNYRARESHGRAGESHDWSRQSNERAGITFERSEEKVSKDKLVENETKRFTANASNEVNLGLNDITAGAGMQSAGALIKYIQDVAVGNIKATDQEIDQRKTQLAALVQAQARALWARAHTPGPDGQSTATVIGEDKVKQLIADVMVPMTSFVEYANSKDSSPAFLAARQNAAILDNDTNKFLINQQTGPAARQIGVVRKTLGDQYFPTFMQNFMATGVDAPFRDVLTQEALTSIAPITDARGQPITRTMKDAIQHGKQINAPPEFHGGVVDLVKGIADPKMPLVAKDKLIEWGFNPKNVGRLDELKTDYRDPNTGEMVPGKYRAFNILSSPGVTQGVVEASKVNPDNYVKYQTTLEREFLGLFRTDVVKLNQIIEKNYLKTHFSWNDKTNELGLVDEKNRPIVRNERALGIEQPNQVYLNSALDVIDRVNKGLGNLANVQKMNPAGAGDTSEYLFRTLKDIRFSPGREVTGAPDNIMKSIFKARNPDTKPEDLDKMMLKIRPAPPVLDSAPDRSLPRPISRFAPEKDMSLQGFLRSPTGEVSTSTGLEPQQTRGVIKGNLSDSKLLDIQTDDIPEGMSARDFIKQLQGKH